MSWRASLALAVALLAAAAAGAADSRTVSRGGRVNLEDHLVPGKHVLFFFHARWCAACRQVGPALDRLAEEQEARLALRKVDVVDWESAVVSQHGVRSIPYLVLYGPDGQRIAAGGANQVVPKLEQALAHAPIAEAHTDRASARDAAPAGASRRGWVPVAIAAVALGLAGLGAMALTRRRGRSSTGPNASELWYVEGATGLEGPYTLRQLRELHADARTPVCRKRDAERMTIGDALRGTS